MNMLTLELQSSRIVTPPTLWKASHNPGHSSSRECQDSMCTLSATSTQCPAQPYLILKVVTLTRPYTKSMGLHEVWDIFHGGTEIPPDLGDLGASCSGWLWEVVYSQRQINVGNLQEHLEMLCQVQPNGEFKKQVLDEHNEMLDR